MIEKPKGRLVDKQDNDLPDSFEKLIEKYGLENVWEYIEDFWQDIKSLSTNVDEALIDIDTLKAQVPIDNLTSTSTSTALSANQGRILNEKIEGYVPEIITAFINRKRYTKTQSWVSINLAPFDRVVKTTDRITVTSTGLKIGAGISKILISAHCQGIDHSSFPGDVTFTIIKNGTTAVRGAESYMTNQGSWCPHDITPLLVDCNESDIKKNDVLSIYMGGGGTGTGELLGEYFTIQIIE